jgi:gliding motility-associated-like protein
MPIVWGDSSRCQGYSLEQYHALSPGAAGYIWSISNAGNSIINQTNGIVEWDSTFSGISIINVYTYGCNGTSPVAQFHVTTIDSVTFTQTGTQNWCSHDVKSIWISPKPYVGNTFQWYNQDGIINGQTDTVLVFNPVDISIQGQYYCRIINICGDTLYSTPDTITVHPRPLVSFTTLGVCLLDTISFTNLSSITDGTVSYEWLFGDNSTSTELNPTHIYTVADTFNIVLIGVSDWGCTNTSNQELIIHGLPQANITTIADSCNGNGRGSIMISPTFGTPPFSYINNGGASQTDSIFTPLPAGSYLITVTDSNGCKTTLPSVITQPDVLLTHFYPNNVLCYNDSSGIVDLVVTGGTLPYQYLWSTGETTEDLSNVPIGNYVVSVIDANGCFTMDSTTLIQPNPLIVDSLIVQPSCLQLNDGKIFVYASGGSGFYDYLWSTGAVSDSIINLSPNKYQITVTDGNGCKSIHDYQISTNGNDCLTIWTSFSPDGDGVNDVWNIGHIDLYPECTVQIFNRWGAQLFESKGYNQPWNGTWNNKDLPAETYYFVIKLGDGSDAITGTVTIIR